MKKNNLIRFVHSLVLLPIITMTFPVGSINNPEIHQDVFVQKLNIATNGIFATNQAVDPEVRILQAKADAIDAYFKEYDMPLEGTGMKMVTEAEKNDLDWRLLPAIAVIESTGGKFACKKATNSFFGWGSCKINFSSKDEAIEIIAWNLGGGNPNTAKHYDGKTVKQILQKYNPPSVVPNYAKKVMRVMSAMGDAEITTDSLAIANT